MTASPAAPSDPGLRTTFPATLLIALAALAAVAPLATDAYLPAFAQMADDLGVSASSVQLTMTTFLVGIALGQLGIGVLSDRVGRRPLLLWGSVLALVSSIGAALSPSLSVLLIARFFQGLGGAAGMVLGRAVISDRSRGITAARALSVVMAIQGIAPVVAPILGGLLVEPIGWRGILGVVAAFTGLLVVMVLLWVPESLPAERRHDGGLRILLDGTRELARDHVLVRLLLINALSFGLPVCGALRASQRAGHGDGGLYGGLRAVRGDGDGDDRGGGVARAPLLPGPPGAGRAHRGAGRRHGLRGGLPDVAA